MGTSKNDRNKVYTTLGASSHSADERQVDDFYATDPRALEMLLDETDLQLSHDVWEPACGAGHLSEVLTARGYDVLSTDLVDRGYGQGGIDFLSDFRTWHGDILTNPPYKHAQRFVEHSMELLEPGKQLVMFLKIQFLESKSRREMFRKYILQRTSTYGRKASRESLLSIVLDSRRPLTPKEKRNII